MLPVPVAQTARDLLTDNALAIDVHPGQSLGIAAEHDVGQTGLQRLPWTGHGGQTIDVGLGRSQTNVKSIRVLPEGDVPPTHIRGK